jgi:hypothetical protein
MKKPVTKKVVMNWADFQDFNMTKQLNESLKYLDMEDQVYPVLGIDQYKSTIGNDSDFVTANFTVKSAEVAKDLVSWLEYGYKWIVDAETSPGEVAPGKFLVFIDMNRRTKIPERIMEILNDLDTLTGIEGKDWKLKIGDSMYPASEKTMKQHLTFSPHEYKETHNDEDEGDDVDLNEMRVIAGLEPVPQYRDKRDDLIRQMQHKAGIY